LLSFFGSLLGQAEKGSVVEVVIGKVEYKSGDQVLPVTKGITIKNGDTIFTGLGQMVILRLSNGGQLVVYEKSEMTMKSKEGDAAKSILELDTGFLWVRVPKLKKDSSFSVDMPGATAGIRGTAFSASVTEKKESQVCVCEGEVKVTNPKGEEAVLKQGQLLKVDSDAPMGKPGRDLKFLKHPVKSTLTCLNCHQGGYSRDGLY
jgi:ferric-dicitrate binding protein FerR (iron transport regulator)